MIQYPTLQYPKLRKAFMQLSKGDVQKVCEVYDSFNKLAMRTHIYTNNETNLTAITPPTIVPLNSFHTSTVHAHALMSHSDVDLITAISTTNAKPLIVGPTALAEKTARASKIKKEMLQSVDIQHDKLNSVLTKSAPYLQSDSAININSPLWAVSQNAHLKREIDMAITDLYQSDIQRLLALLVDSGSITVEDGIASLSLNGKSYVFDIPPEWDLHSMMSESREGILRPTHENRERDALWNQIITNAIDLSPGEMVNRLPEEERAQVLRREWLIDGLLTGICTGLALEFLLETELNGTPPQSVVPSDEARYWTKLLIPVMEKVANLYDIDHLDQLNQEHHYREVYKEMIKIIEKKAHLKGFVQCLHVPLCQLGEKLQSTEGHSLVIIELSGTNIVVDNHTIYFNATDRTIADNGMMIHVPEEDDYGAFVDFYMEKMEYHHMSDRFTLISVIKDPRFDRVRKPSKMDRILLSTERVFKSLLEHMVVPNPSINDIY